ncbi:hypothetical protein, partial [Pseudomonas tremae]|uniref:hypothetical protein n=1 Tax=Pseudomonas tremae TaxID=200454 RepID=UPI001F43E217
IHKAAPRTSGIMPQAEPGCDRGRARNRDFLSTSFSSRRHAMFGLQTAIVGLLKRQAGKVPPDIY